jgi:N-methylhydantoinase A
MGLLVNIDNGGTFTDVCVRSDQAVIHSKSPTTPHDLTQCFVDSLRRVSVRLYGEEDLGRLMRECDYLRYSTTAGTNSVVERKGVPSALLVESGAENDVYGARGTIEENGLWSALVHDQPVGLSVAGPDGIDPGELTKRINEVLAGGAQRLVIVMKSEETEQAIKSLLLDKYPRHLLGAVPFLLSYELVREDNHARRAVTALLNSYLHPGMEHFLFGAERACKTNRLQRPLLIFRNDGDSARVAKTTAIKTWGSGPRGGLEGAVAYAGLYRSPCIAAMDIGGTTTDVAIALDGRVRRNMFGEVEGAQISLPLPEMHSYGLGGSSVIRVVDGEIVIGPESVGAAPGPACFGRGGSSVTSRTRCSSPASSTASSTWVVNSGWTRSVPRPRSVSMWRRR